MGKYYIVKDEYVQKWGNDSTIVVDDAEVARLAAEWETTVEELLTEVTPANVFCLNERPCASGSYVTAMNGDFYDEMDVLYLGEPSPTELFTDGKIIIKARASNVHRPKIKKWLEKNGMKKVEL